MLVNGELNSAQIEGFPFASLPDPTLMKRRIVYDQTNNRMLVSDGTQWRPTGSTGGGSGLNWVEGAPAPEAQFENGMLVFAFSQIEGQNISTAFKIPSLYVGSPIKMKFDVLSADNTGNVEFEVVSTLIRQGIDPITDTTNQEVFNQVINLSAGTVEIPQEISAEVTDANGEINGVAVTAGDYVKITLKRVETDMSAEKARIPVYAMELTFD